MSGDPEVKLSGVGRGGKPRLVVRFHSVAPLLALYKQVRDNGVFSIDVQETQPTTLALQVLFRTKRRGEEFPATILTWARGLAVLQPSITLRDFKELTGALVHHLSSEKHRETKPPPSDGPALPRNHPRTQDRVSDTLTELQAAGADRLLPEVLTTSESIPVTPAPTRSEGPAEESGMWKRVASATVPREAYRWLDRLLLTPNPLARGEGTGKEALAAAAFASDVEYSVLFAEAMDDERRWYLFYHHDKLLTGYLRPATAVTALPTLLSRQGLTSAQAAEDAFRLAGEQAVPPETAIMSLGIVDGDLFRKALNAKVRLLTSLLGSEKSVRYSLRQLKTPLPLPDAVDAPASSNFKELITEYEGLPLSELQARLEDFVSQYPRLSRPGAELAEEMGLDKPTSHFIEKCLDGQHSLRVLPNVSPLSRQRTLAVVLALRERNLLDFRERDAKVSLLRRFGDKLVAQRDKLGQVHDFDFLNLHWSATAREIERAASQIEAMVQDAKVNLLAETHQRAAREVSAEVARIRASLATVEGRREYRATILDPFAVDQAVELLLSNFDMALYRRDISEIQRILGRLKELNPRAALAARQRLPKPDEDGNGTQ